MNSPSAAAVDRHPGTLEAQGWEPADSSNFLDHVGPVWVRTDGDRLHLGAVIDDRHDNTQRRAHGGMIMALCDDGMGRTAQRTSRGRRMFTIAFECQFVSGASVGDFVEVHSEVVRSTRSLVFMRSTCFVGHRVVATASGIWKVLET